MNIKFIEKKIHITHTNLKICSHPLTIREMKVNVVISYHFSPTRFITQEMLDNMLWVTAVGKIFGKDLKTPV